MSRQDPFDNVTIGELFDEGRFEEAEAVLAEYGEAEPFAIEARSLRALCLAELGRVDEAIPLADEAVDREPGSAFCHWVFGTLLCEADRLGEALMSAQSAVSLEPREAAHHSLLARVHARRGEWGRCRAAAEQGVLRDPADETCRRLFALAVESEEDDDDGVRGHGVSGTRGPPSESDPDLSGSSSGDAGRYPGWAGSGQTPEGGSGSSAEPAGEESGGEPEMSQAAVDATWTSGRGDRASADVEPTTERSRLTPLRPSATPTRQSPRGTPGTEQPPKAYAPHLDSLVGALDSRSPLHLVLKLLFWIRRLDRATRLLYVLTGWLVYEYAFKPLSGTPGLAKYGYSVIALWLFFLVVGWVARPLSDFLLAHSGAGRGLLCKERRLAANLVTGLLAMATIAALVSLATGWERAAIGALAFGFVALPAKEVFECSPGWTRKTMLAYTWIAGAFAIIAAAAPMPLSRVSVALAVSLSVVASWLAVALRHRIRHA